MNVINVTTKIKIMNSSKLQIKTKSILTLALGLVFALIAAAALVPAEANAAVNWVANPASCPQSDPANFPGQNCAPNNMCGDSSGIAQCYNTGSISAPAVSANSSVLYASALGGGYVINCFAVSDAGIPYCDNNGAAWCNRDASCFGGGNNRLTTCLSGTWAYQGASAFTCGDCLSTHLDCTGDTKCEVQKNVTTYPTGGNNHYGTTCNSADVRCNTNYYDCDATGVTVGNGCEAYRAGACTAAGGLPGTWSCAVDAGGTCTDGGSNYTCTCVTPKCPFESATLCQYFSADPLLWGKQLGSGELIRMGNSVKEDAFVVENDGSIRMATTSAPGDTTGLLYNVGGDLYWDGTLIGVGASSSALDFQQVTDLGNITTNWIQFAGGTSTADFSITGNLNVTGDAIFVNATGTNIAVAEQFLLGQYALLPVAGYRPGAMVYSTTDSSPYFWDGTQWVAFATGTGAGAGDLQAVTDIGNITTNWIEFAGGTSTADFYSAGKVTVGDNDARATGNLNILSTHDYAHLLIDANGGVDSWGSAYITLNGGSDGGEAGIEFQNNGTAYGLLYATPSTYLMQSRLGADIRITSYTSSDLFISGTNGRVGIGSTMPQSSLHVASINFADTPVLTLENLIDTVQTFVVNANPEGSITASIGDMAIDGTNGRLYIKETGTGTNTGWVAFATGTGSGTGDLQAVTDVGNLTTNWIEFAGGTSTDSVSILGNVGINTLANPAYQLYLYGGPNYGEYFAVGDGRFSWGDTSDAIHIFANKDDGEMRLSSQSNISIGDLNNSFTGARLDFDGQNGYTYFSNTNVGIGTASPMFTFHTVNDGTFLGAFTNSTFSEGIMFVNDNWGDEIGMSDIRSDGIIAAVSKADSSAFYYANRVLTARTDIQGLGINTDPARSLHVYAGYGETALARMDNDYGSFEMHNVNTNPNGFATGTIGSLAVDSTSGRLYIKETGTGTNTGWVAFATGTGAGAGDLQAVTDVGNLTTNWIQFAGGTSTGNFLIDRPSAEAYLTVRSGNSDAYFDLIGNAGATALRMSSNGGSDYATFEIASNGSFNMVAGGTNTIWADAPTGNVGIGHNSPTDLLHVYSDTRSSALRVSSGGGQNAYVIVDYDRAGGAEGSFSFQENGVQRGVMNSGWNGYDFFAIGADSGYDLDFVTTGVPRVHITNATGRVGIGTITPSTRLHVNSDAASTTAIATYQNNAGDYQQFLVTSNPQGLVTGSRGDLAIDSANGRLYIKETGNGTNTGWVALGSAGVANSIWDADSDTGVQVEESADEDIIRFDVAGYEAMRIDPTLGEPLVSINSTLGGYAKILQNINDEYDHFEIRAADVLNAFGGDLVFNFNPEEGFALYYASNQSSMNIGRQSFGVSVNNNLDAIKVDQNAFVGLSTSSPMYRLDVVGDARVSEQLMLGQYALNPLVGLQAGAMVYNTASSTPFFWDGTEWIAFATGTGAAAGDLQAVTDLGNITTNWIEFAGGTSTNDFAIIRPNAETHFSVISGDSDAIMILEGNAGASELRMSSDGGSDWASLLVDGDGSFNLHTSGSGRNMYINSATGYIGVNTIVPDARLTVSGEGATANSALSIENFSSNLADFPGITLKAAQGDSGTIEAVDSGKTLGAMVFQGHNGTTFDPGSVILSRAVGDWDGINNGANLIFYTTELGGGFLRQRASIDSEGLYIGSHAGHTALAPLDIDVEGGIGSPAIALNSSGTGFMIFNSDADPEGYITGSVGDLAVDSVSGVMYIKETGDATNTGWSAFATGTAGALDLQQVTDNGNITTNWIEFAGGTSTGTIIPGANNTYALGSSARRWSDVWGANVHIGTSTWDLAQAANGALTVTRAGGSEAMRILTNGNVGIGTELPGTYRLNVAGNAYFSVGEDTSVFEVYNSPKANSHIRVDGDSNYVVLQENSGNVGIGESVPSYKLHIDGGVTAGNNLFRAEAGLNGGYISMYVSSTDDRNSVFEWQRNLDFNSNSENVMTLANQGYVGIGVQTPAAGLDVRRGTEDGYPGVLFQQTIKASSDDQILAGLRIDPTFNDGGFSNIGEYGLHVVYDPTGGTNIDRRMALLVLENNSHAGMTIRSGINSAGGVRFADPDNNDVGGIMYSHSNDSMLLSTNDDNRLIIDNSGNVGIVNMSPAYKLDITGDARLTAQFMLGQYALNPASGLQAGAMIYNTASSTPFYWNGTAWKALASQDLITLDRAYDAGGSGVGRQIRVDSGAVWLTDAGNGTALQVDYSGTGEAVAVTNGSTGRGFVVAQNGTGVGMYIRQSNGTGLVVENNTGNYGIYVDANSTGDAMRLNNYGTGASALYIDNSADGYGINIDHFSGVAGMAIRNDSSSDGDLINLTNESAGVGILLANSGTGNGIQIPQTGAGQGIYIRQHAGTGMQLDNNTANHGFILTNGSTGNGMNVRNNGTSGNGIYINNDTDGAGILIDDTLGKTSININKSGGSGDLIKMANSGSGDSIEILQASTGKGLLLTNLGTGDSLYIADEAADTTPFVLTSKGDLGIGTDQPDGRLHILADNSSQSPTLLKFQSLNDPDIQSQIYFSAGGNATNWNVNSSGNGGALSILDGTTEVAKFMINGVVINDGSTASIDFRVESDTNTHALFVDATNGNVGFEQSTPLAKLHVGGTTAGSAADYDYLRMQGNGDVDHRVYKISGSNLVAWDYNVTGNGGAIEFRNGSSRVGLFTNSGLVINEGGVTGIGLRVEGDNNANLLYTDAANDRVGIGTNAPGVRFHATQSANTVAAFDRTTSDGAIISLRQDGTEEGTISVSGTTVSYNAFTGSHYAWTDELIERGMLVSLTGDNRNLHNNPQSEIVYGVTKTAIANDSKVMGSYLALQESNKAYDESNPHLIMAVGNGEVWVADKGENINIGDYLISSDVAGHAQKDAGEFIVSHIIAKAAESIDWSSVTTEIDGVKHKKISVFFESFDKSNMQSSVAGTSLQGGDTNLEVVDLAVGNAVFEGNITVMEHVVLSRDAVGQAMILTGEKKVSVTFEVPYDQLPIVTVTPFGAKRMDYGVENVSLTGFDIVIDPIQYQDIIFNWHAFGNREAKVFVSNGTTLDIEMTEMGSSKLESDINSNGQAVVSEPVEEGSVMEPVTPEPDTSSEPTSEPATELEPEQTAETSTEPEPASVIEPESEQAAETVIETVE